MIAETLKQFWVSRGKTKYTPSGWISGNAPCCDDTRYRGGLIINEGDALSYSCFNCGFKASWQPGRPLSKNMKKFMQYLDMNDTIILKLSFQALKLLGEYTNDNPISIIPTFNHRALPLGSVHINDVINNAHIPASLIPILTYIHRRGLYLDDYPFYWTPHKGYNNRLIIPYFYENKIVGYTSRAIDNSIPRYIAEQQPGYLFNIDAQRDNRKFIIVCEGPIDAISIGGCAIMGADIKESQHILLKQLRKEIILVPDRDAAGPKTVEQAMEFGWSVSFPEWPDGVKDINDAVVKLGIGKKSFAENKLVENAQYVIEAVNHANPTTVKGTLIKSLSVATTMGPGVKVAL